MEQEVHALSGLKEIPLPEPIPYVPQTVGWILLGALAAAAIGYGLWRLVRRYHANEYRRAAMKELQDIEAGLHDSSSRSRVLAAIPALLKRTALSAAGREAVASLSDRAWLEFLDRTCAPGGFSKGPGRLLATLSYGGEAELARIRESEVKDLLAQVRRWIQRHDARL